MSEREKALAAREELVGVLSMLERQEFRAGYDAHEAEVEQLERELQSAAQEANDLNRTVERLTQELAAERERNDAIAHLRATGQLCTEEESQHEEGDCAYAESLIERLDEALCDLLHHGDEIGEHSPETHLELYLARRAKGGSVECPACGYEGDTWAHKCKAKRFLDRVARTADLPVTIMASSAMPDPAPPTELERLRTALGEIRGTLNGDSSWCTPMAEIDRILKGVGQ